MNRLLVCTFKIFILVVTFGSSLGSQNYNICIENYALAHVETPELVEEYIHNFSQTNPQEGNFFMGLHHLGSYGAPINYDQANESFYQSCKGGFALGCKALADSYMAGHGVQKNYFLAKIFYYQGAKLGYGPAQLNVAFMFKNGEGCVKNQKKACYWLKKAFWKEEMIPLLDVIKTNMAQLGCRF